jgi:hypothetical protein
MIPVMGSMDILSSFFPFFEKLPFSQFQVILGG